MSGTPSIERLRELYLPPAGDVVFVDVPRMTYVMVDGEGSLDEPFAHAVRWLFAAVHPIKRIAKQRMGRHFVEPPLEGLWWADDVADLAAGRKHELRWRMMIPAPDWADAAMLADAVVEAARRHGEPPASLRLDDYDEGRCVQTLYVGDYEKEASRIARRLHEGFLPAHGLVASGPHHEIYLNDPSRTAPGNRRTVVRQPVCEGPNRAASERTG